MGINLNQVYGMIAPLYAERIVTCPRGAWRWQDAYSISRYRARLARDGRVMWYSVERCGKWSEPQLRRYGIVDGIVPVQGTRYGSLHHRQVWRDEAVRQIGDAQVRILETYGLKFYENQQVTGEVA